MCTRLCQPLTSKMIRSLPSGSPVPNADEAMKPPTPTTSRTGPITAQNSWAGWCRRRSRMPRDARRPPVLTHASHAWPADAGGTRRTMKLLVLATDPVDADDLRGALDGEDLAGAEVLVVSPAVNESPVAFWMSDSDEAILEAESTAEKTAQALAEAGARTRAQTGESDPLLALQDALTTFRADRVVVFARGEEEAQRYREDDVLGEAQRRFGVPVAEVTR